MGSLCFADIVHLKEGGSVDGEILERTSSECRVRTVYGIIAIATDNIDRIEVAPTVFDRYADKLKSAADTADAQADLGIWCKESGLRSEARKHLSRAVELNAGHELARDALGHVRIDGKWTDRPASQPASKPAPPASSDEDDEQKLIAKTQIRWTQQIRAIRTNNLDSVDAGLVADGRKKIAAIRDPLAILPLVQVLSDGSLNSRQTLVDSLKRFTEDEATLNLAAMALLESDDDLRQTVVDELVRRKDPRVDAQFRKALSTDNDVVVKRAAVALGALRSVAAIPELIERLTVQRRKTVEVPIPSYFGAMADEFRPRGDYIQPGRRLRYRPLVGVGAAGAFVRVETAMKLRDVTVFRTEVQQALVAITGENFGFEADEWRRWYQEKKR